MSNWRPRDWKNPYPESLYYGTLPVGLHSIFEAGADAMLEVLRKQGTVIRNNSPEDKITVAIDGQILALGQPGKVVYIPDDPT